MRCLLVLTDFRQHTLCMSVFSNDARYFGAASKRKDSGREQEQLYQPVLDEIYWLLWWTFIILIIFYRFAHKIIFYDFGLLSTISIVDSKISLWSEEAHQKPFGIFRLLLLAPRLPLIRLPDEENSSSPFRDIALTKKNWLLSLSELRPAHAIRIKTRPDHFEFPLGHFVRYVNNNSFPHEICRTQSICSKKWNSCRYLVNRKCKRNDLNAKFITFCFRVRVFRAIQLRMKSPFWISFIWFFRFVFRSNKKQSQNNF